MNVIRTENNKTNNRALVISAERWKNLKNMITEKNDDIIANNEIEKLKNERKASKTITESWATTKMNQRRKEIEKKQKLLADIETMKVKRDEEIKLKTLERRNEIVEKMQLEKWSERDSTKAITRELHNMELLKKKQLISEKIAEKAYNNKVQKINASDRDYQDTINEKEQQYMKDEQRKKDLAEKRKKDINDFKKKFDQENQKEKERLTLSIEWESKRNEQDTKFLMNLRQSSYRKKIDEMNHYREQLDIQCNDNIMTKMAEKQEELQQYNAIKKLWHQEDEEFMTCINKLIDIYKKAKISVVPLLKIIEIK